MNTPLEDDMQILIRTTVELKAILQKEAKRIGITLNALILQILWDWAKKADLVKQTESKEAPS